MLVRIIVMPKYTNTCSFGHLNFRHSNKETPYSFWNTKVSLGVYFSIMKRNARVYLKDNKNYRTNKSLLNLHYIEHAIQQ